jgi:pimeloyl-ACP methyl ester carboxylesterase
MRTRLTEIPELSAEEHPLLILPERKVQLPAGPRSVVRYRETGQGRPVLLLHGPWTSIFKFRNLLYSLHGEHRVIVPEVLDLIGEPTGVLPEKLAQSILELVTALELKRPVVVGHAECGIAALDLAVSRPEALAAVVVLGSSLQLALPQRLRGLWLTRRFAMRQYAHRCFSNPHTATMALLPTRRPDLLSQQEIRYMAQRFASLPLTRRTVAILAQTIAPVFYRAVTTVIQRIREKQPAIMLRLLYTDTRHNYEGDRTHGDTLNQLVPGSELFITEPQIEDPAVERPALTANIIAVASKASG